VVDNAYGAPFPRIGGPATAPVRHDRVINVFSLSKTGLPGERLGFAIGDQRYVDPIVSFLANSTLHAPQLAQSALTRALRSRSIDTLLDTVIGPFYVERRHLVETLLRESLPGDVAWRMHEADGGIFCWLWVDEDWYDDLSFYEALKTRGVFVVPGRIDSALASSGEAMSVATRC
jgi:valine--pyruvate aminotransferase